MGRARVGGGRAAVVLLGVAVLAGPALLTAPPAAVRAAGPAGPSVTPDGSTTVIEADARTISLRQWFSAIDVGTDSQSDRTFTWTAPSTTDELDVVVFGGGGGGGGARRGNPSLAAKGGGGGGGGGGEVRRDAAVAVTPGETLDATVGAGGLAGAGGGNADPAVDGTAGEDGAASSLRRGGTDLMVASGGVGGGGGGDSTGGTGGAGGTGGSGGALLTDGVAGVTGVASATPPSAATGLDNAGAAWMFNGVRLGLGGGGGGGKSSNGGTGANNNIGPGTTATTAAVHELSDLTSTITRIGGDGDGGNDRYVSILTKHAPARLGGGGGGGAYVTSFGHPGGRGGSGGVILHYAVADLIVSELTPTETSIPVTTGSTDISLQLRDAFGTATDISVGPISFAVAGTDATLGTVTDNDDGTYTATLTAGAVGGTATVTATVVGSDFTDTAVVTIVAPDAGSGGGATPTVTCSPDPVAPGGTVACDVAGGDAAIDILWRADRGDGTDPVETAGVTLDATGTGRFTFRAPLAPVPATLRVALVGWGVDAVLAVTSDGAAGASGGEPLPSAIRAGGMPATTSARWTPLSVALGAGLVAGLLATRRRAGSRR